MQTAIRVLPARLFQLSSGCRHRVTGVGNSRRHRASVSLLLIGDEILSGKVQDRNLYKTAKLLAGAGITLKSVEVLPDSIDVIASTIRSALLSGSVNGVVTSGGIGPTHDDVTYEAIALATDTELKLDEMTAKQMEKMSRKKYGEGWEMNEWRRKMAVLPTPSHIQRVEGLWCPVVTAYLQAEAGKGAGVTALPGVPPLFDKMLSAAISERDGVFHPMVKASRVVASVFTQMTEGDIAALLTECQNNVAKKGIMIGSYPAFNMAEGMMDYRVKVSIEGDEKEDVEDVAFWLAQRLDGRMTIGDK